ncbi:unnamed protein product [Lepeophtheirus salmonis]|uniref:(salmon louse) hypothetical protein n=1 Tax=Lepeophtheirus salmonis TaxID=72036 RepID=A0A7R8CKJ6_LEPSM|nr:unnamed protein product [Lepeophtheirus salmonis]CAF2816431.1 unnamed protein product [Lepeophtheirus salmonis]
MEATRGTWKHELLNLTPIKRLKTDAVSSLLLPTSTVPKPEDQCDKKLPKNLHESTSSQTPSSVDKQSEDQVDFVTPRSRREMRRQNKLYHKKNSSNLKRRKRKTP